MKKVIVLFLIMLLCGCKATYNLEIKNSIFKEKISINSNDLKYFKDNKFYAIMNGVSNFVEYDKKNAKDSIFFSHTYKFDDYSKATILKTCFKAYNIVKEDNYYLLSTSDSIKCAIEEDRVLLDDLDVIIKTNHKVIDTNADEVNNYKYIWHFNKNNYNKKTIYLKLYKDKYVFNYENELLINLSIIIGSVLTILIIIFIMIKKIKKANKF